MLTIERFSDEIFILFLQLIAGLGCVIFRALDFSLNDDEERDISKQLETLLEFMVQKGKW